MSVKKSKITGPAAVSDVASAIRDVATSMTVGDANDAPTTPQRRMSAIRAIEKDNNLSASKRVKAMRLFRRDIAAAEAYLASENTDLRTQFILAELEDF